LKGFDDILVADRNVGAVGDLGQRRVVDGDYGEDAVKAS
jgi:hypothetical protein